MCVQPAPPVLSLLGSVTAVSGGRSPHCFGVPWKGVCCAQGCGDVVLAACQPLWEAAGSGTPKTTHKGQARLCVVLAAPVPALGEGLREAGRSSPWIQRKMFHS